MARQLPKKLLGFIGVGNMGSGMASNLLRSGQYRLVVMDKNKDAVARLVDQGALAAESPAEVATTPGLHALLTMLPSSQHVRDAYLGPEGVLSVSSYLQPHLLIDCSTIDPITSQQVAEAASGCLLHPDAREAHGGQSHPKMIDAPVSGGVPGAQAATLTFMCGGHREAVEEAAPILERMGKKIIYCGKSGAGQAAKLANNLVLAISMAGVSEGLALGKRLGLDPKLLTDIFNSSSGRCWSSDTYNPVPGVMEGVPSSRNYTGGFSSSLMIKDLGLALTAGEHCHSPMPLTQAVSELYRQVAKADPATDFSAIYKHLYNSGKGQAQ